MTARQPPGEKGAKACTIGYTSPASWIFCTYFPGVRGNEVYFYEQWHSLQSPNSLGLLQSG